MLGRVSLAVRTQFGKPIMHKTRLNVDFITKKIEKNIDSSYFASKFRKV